MKKLALALVLVTLSVAMFGCGGTAEETVGSSYEYNANNNYNNSGAGGSYK